MGFQGTFKRFEKKYLVTEAQFQALLARFEPYMAQDDYGLHTICNIYYDTEDFRLIRNSIRKPVYKEKLRLRSYGVAGADSPDYLELKKKVQGTVFKRRAQAALADAMCYMDGGIPSDASQILREIAWFLRFYHPQPRVYIAYERLAMFGKEDSELRITFDAGIRCRTTGLDLTKGTQGEPIMGEGLRLMEIKIPGAMPIWMCKLFTELRLYPCSFSKYGEYYKQYIAGGAQPAVSGRILTGTESLAKAIGGVIYAG